MNFLDAIQSQISIADYESCWLSAPPASFDYFVSFLSSSLQKQLPADVVDFAIRIDLRGDNRIGLHGSFYFELTKYKLFGDIVYLPGMKSFRGRPGFNKCYEHTCEMEENAPADGSTTRTLVELRESTFLESSADDFPQAAIAACRDALKDATRQLESLVASSPQAEKEQVIRKCIESINSINREFDDFIDTEIREQLVDALVEISSAAEIDSSIARRIDDWRDW